METVLRTFDRAEDSDFWLEVSHWSGRLPVNKIQEYFFFPYFSTKTTHHLRLQFLITVNQRMLCSSVALLLWIQDT